MSRVILELCEARYAASPWPRAKRGRGKRAAGLRYEANVRKELERRGQDFAHGPWIEFFDANGRGFAQPDFVVFGDKWFLLESKLTQTDIAFSQMNLLYLPLLRYMHPGIEIIPVQVCKVLKSSENVVEDFRNAQPGDTWHWIQ